MVFQNFGATELIIILIIIIILFGARKIPELIRSIGKSVKEVRQPSTDRALTKKSKKN